MTKGEINVIRRIFLTPHDQIGEHVGAIVGAFTPEEIQIGIGVVRKLIEALGEALAKIPGHGHVKALREASAEVGTEGAAEAFAPLPVVQNTPTPATDYARDGGPLASLYAWGAPGTEPDPVVELRPDRAIALASEPGPSTFTAHGLRLRLWAQSKPPATLTVGGSIVVTAAEWALLGASPDGDGTIYGVAIAPVRIEAGHAITCTAQGGRGRAALAARVDV